MGNPLEHRCICCWSARPESPAGYPPVCVSCLKQLSPGDKAAILASTEQTELLRDIRGFLDAMNRGAECDANERVSIAKGIENLGRQLKLPAGKVTELVNQFQPVARLLFEMLSEAAKKSQDDGDDDHPFGKPWEDRD